MGSIQRTKAAVKTKTYSYEAVVAALIAVLTYAPDVINWLLHDPAAPTVPEQYKPYLNMLAFGLALYARSIVVRKPPEQDSTPPQEPTP